MDLQMERPKPIPWALVVMREGLPEVMASRVQLQQVILNLIMNAVEAMSSVTGRERRLTIRSCLDQPATLTITVEDAGTRNRACPFPSRYA